MDCLFMYLKIFRLGPSDRIQLMGIVQSHGPLLSLHQSLLHQKHARIFFLKRPVRCRWNGLAPEPQRPLL